MLIQLILKKEYSSILTEFKVRHSSSHFTVRSTDVLFLLSETHDGTSSAKDAQMSGFMDEIISMYSTGLIYNYKGDLEIFFPNYIIKEGIAKVDKKKRNEIPLPNDDRR